MKYNNETPTEKCEKFNSEINSLSLSNFIDLNTNGKIYWDPDDEQIMYFLDYLPRYKFWDPPSSVLRQYLDFNYTFYSDSNSNRVNLTNFQKVCGVYDTLDFWVSTESKCLNNYYRKPGPTYDTYILPNNNQSCLPIDSALTNTQCQTNLGCYDVGKLYLIKLVTFQNSLRDIHLTMCLSVKILINKLPITSKFRNS
jgi:hypothetical protein